MEACKNVGGLKECFGCGVCSMACPQNIITIKENRKGFYSPVIIDGSKCIECGICLANCSYYNTHDTVTSVPCASYAGWSTNANVRQRSSSGGVAFELANCALKHGYRFCGVKYDSKSRRAVHYIGSYEQDIFPSAGSKYLPSFTEDAFSKLNNGEKYIVFGTPCQIASLRLWLKKRHIEHNFILVDFFCHGVPSLKIWDKYIREKRLDKGLMSSINWRDKLTGWHDSWHIVAKDMTGEELYRSEHVSNDEFYQYFLGHYSLNECCMNACRFKMYASSADIRLGDLWGERYKDDEHGVSAILCFTPNGLEILEKCTDSLLLVPEDPETVSQGQMRTCAVRPRGFKFVKLLSRYLPLGQSLRLNNYACKLISIPGRIVRKSAKLIRK